MIVAHRIQLDPTEKQVIYFAKACGTARLVWNFALAEWKDQYRLGGKPSALQLSRYFNSFKYEKYPWLAEIHRDAHQRPFLNLKRAFNNFFNGTAKYPKFKKKGKCRDSFYVSNDRFSVDSNRVRLPVIGSVRMNEQLRFSGKIQSGVVSRDADRWFISITVEMEEKEVAKSAGPSIGIDVGLTTFATISDGRKIDAPKPLSASMKRFRRLSRQHSHKKFGSNNRKKAAMRLARCHRRIKNIRSDFVHKLTTDLAKNHSRICVENLNVAGMVRNRCLSRAISDAAWSEMFRQLDYKTRLHGSELICRDRFFASSKLCSGCSHRLESLPLSVREWTCPACGSLHDRDHNAAKNLNNPIPAASRESTPREIAALALSSERETAIDERGTTAERTYVRSHRR